MFNNFDGKEHQYLLIVQNYRLCLFDSLRQYSHRIDAGQKITPRQCAYNIKFRQ